MYKNVLTLRTQAPRCPRIHELRLGGSWDTLETTPPLTKLGCWRQLAWWSLACPIVMLVALVRHNVYLLNWIHVLSGALWTGGDLFMGFVLGPVLRVLEIRVRTAVIAYLVPRTLLYFPMVSLTTGTAGWFAGARFSPSQQSAYLV